MQRQADGCPPWTLLQDLSGGAQTNWQGMGFRHPDRTTEPLAQRQQSISPELSAARQAASDAGREALLDSEMKTLLLEAFS